MTTRRRRSVCWPGAEEWLRAEGWHVFVPPAGLPRLTARRDERLGRRELTLVHAQPAGRLVLRIRAEDLPVGRTCRSAAASRAP